VEEKMKFRSVVLSAVFLALFAGRSQAQSSLSIEDVMTTAQLRVTGISSLTTPQREALDQWLNDYTQMVVQIAIRPDGKAVPAEYGGLDKGHRVQKVSDEGRTVELEDGSQWEINATDRLFTGQWLPIMEIFVTAARNPVGAFKYSLTNKEVGEIALARYVGK
jgi:hypothetical protein